MTLVGKDETEEMEWTSDRIKELRKKLGGISQTYLGMLLGVHSSFVGHMESKLRKPSKKMIKGLNILERVVEANKILAKAREDLMWFGVNNAYVLDEFFKSACLLSTSSIGNAKQGNHKRRSVFIQKRAVLANGQIRKPENSPYVK